MGLYWHELKYILFIVSFYGESRAEALPFDSRHPGSGLAGSFRGYYCCFCAHKIILQSQYFCLRQIKLNAITIVT